MRILKTLTDRSGGRGGALGFVLKNAPFSMLANALPGIINYAVILYLFAFHTAEDAGVFRIMTAVLGLFGVLSLFEMGTVYVQRVVSRDTHAMIALFTARVVITLGGTFLFVLGHFAIFQDPAALPYYALLGCFAALKFPGTLFLSVNQALKRFQTSFWLNLAAYGGGFLAFVAVMELTGDSALATYAFIALSALVGFLGFFWVVREFGFFGQFKAAMRAFRLGDLRDAFMASLSQVVPQSLLHLDKLILAAVTNTAFVGYYSLGFSTGRLILNLIKPGYYIFFSRFVEKMPSWRSLAKVFAVGTISGLGLAAGLYVVVFSVPLMPMPWEAFCVALIILPSYGLALANSIYTHAVILNRDADTMHVLKANIWAAAAVACLFAPLPVVSPIMAILITAAWFPLRHLVSFVYFIRVRSAKAPNAQMLAPTTTPEPVEGKANG